MSDLKQTGGEVIPVFLRVPPREIAYIKFLFESYEEIAIVRTHDEHEAIIVVLAMPDFWPAVRAVLDELQEHLPCEEVPAPPEAAHDWLMREL
jgi:hypothetical protein